MGVVLGLVVALTYGTSDFLGGLASRRRHVLEVVPPGQAISAVLVGLVMLATWDRHQLLGVDVARGAAAGVCVSIALVLLFRGLAAGAMSVVAPITAVGAAVVPFVWGLLQGERPGGPAIAGALLAIVAVVLVARPAPAAGQPAAKVPPGEVVLAVVAGLGFGAVFVLLGDTSADSGLWPVLASKATAGSLVTAAALAGGHRPRPGRELPLVAGTGALDAVANAAYLVASRSDLISVVAVVSSLYPAATLLLARLVLGERTSRLQQLGLALVLGGVVLLATG